jgi:hypothetical protein
LKFGIQRYTKNAQKNAFHNLLLQDASIMGQSLYNSKARNLTVIISNISVLNMESPAAKEQAARALANLAEDPDNAVTIAREGGLAPLIRLLSEGTPTAREYAAGALLRLPRRQC